MRLNTMEKLYRCLQSLEPRVEMSEELRLRAKVPIDRMLALS
jgi:quinolinate synthase